MDVGVIVSTLSWTSACEELHQQLDDDDELILVCDTESDPLFNHEGSENAKIMAAGEPEGCSGKCNALAYGLEKASKEYVVCTDGDFSHPDGWLNSVKESLETGSFVTTPNFFKSKRCLANSWSLAI